MELVRQILIAIEDHEHGFAPDRIEVPGYTEETIGFHLVLMDEAGLIVAADTTVLEGPSPSDVAERMTWAGYEFLSDARNETVWRKVQRTVVAKGGSISFEVLRFLVVNAAKDYFLSGPPPP